MIASLRGNVIAVTATQVVIEVHGVGYNVRMSGKDLNQLHAGQEAYILTTLIISQDALSLYGFLHKSTQDLFTQLQKVSGIGPRAAMAILSTLSADELAHAIRDNNVTALTKAPGVGKKGAQKIIVELSGSVNLDSLIEDEDQSTYSKDSTQELVDAQAQQVVQGLISLGWQQRDAIEAVNKTMQDMGITMGLESSQVSDVLRHALTRLDRGR